MINDALNSVAVLLEEYRETIRKANSFSCTQEGYKRHYEKADMIEKRMKTELYKYVCSAVEIQLDAEDEKIRQQKNCKDA